MADPDVDLSSIWRDVLLDLAGKVAFQQADRLSSVGLHAMVGDTAVLAVPNAAVRDAVETRSRLMIAEALSRRLGVAVHVAVLVNPDTVDQTTLLLIESGLNPGYTFETFEIGASCRFAQAASVAVAESPGKAYNPLFLYGDSGLGKTHLLHAIGQHAIALGTARRVRYATARDFTNDFLNSVRDDTMIAFQRHYRDVDILLLDDIQFLENREGTHEEFFHTFNTLHNANKQIVISSDRKPKDLATPEDRLRTQFEWGLLADIQPPDLETRIAILQKKAAQERLFAPADVLEFIASRIQDSIRKLEGALIRVTAFANLTRSPVQLALAEEVLRGFPFDGTGSEITADQIIASTADYFGISLDDLKGHIRSRVCINARQVAMYLCRELTDLSLPRIGQAFGGRDHTTVMHADRKIRQQMAERRSLYNQIAELTTRIASVDADDRSAPGAGAGSAEHHEQQARLAVAEGRLEQAKIDLVEMMNAYPDRAERLVTEFGFLLEQPLPGAAEDPRITWLSGLWTCLSAEAPFEWPDAVTLWTPEPSPPADVTAAAPMPAPDPKVRSSRDRPGAQEVGRHLEEGFVDLLRMLFAVSTESAAEILVRLRRQQSGTQFGHDIEFDTVDAATRTVRCHVECKNYQRPITLDDIGGKILDTDFHWRDRQPDHFIVVSPHSDAANGLSLMLQTWNADRRYPFDVHIWSPETGIKELFGLVPEVYERLYGEAPAPLASEERSAVASRWRARLRPVVRLPKAWQRYLTTPSQHCIIGEDAVYFDQIRRDPMSLHAQTESGGPISGTLNSAVRDWLANPSDQSLLLLGEFGDGKSFFCYQLGLDLAREYLDGPREGWIALRIALREMRDAGNPSALLANRLAQLGTDVAEWQRISQSGDINTVVMLDGFDEMSTRLDPHTVASNIRRLEQCVGMFPRSKVLITSRTHFFENAQDHQRFLDHAGRPRIFRIAPITRTRCLDHMTSYAHRINAEAKVAQLRRLYDPIGLAAKPLFLQMIKETLPNLPADQFDELTLYRQYVRESLERKLSDLRDELSSLVDEDLLTNLQAVLEEVALRLHGSGGNFVSLRDFAMQRSDDLATVLWRISDSAARHDPTGPSVDAADARSRIGIRSLLKPVHGAGVAAECWPVDFFHRSMREYFVARALVRAIVEDRAAELLSRLPLQPEIVHFAILLMRDPGQLGSDLSSDQCADRLFSLARSAVRAVFDGKHLGGNAVTLLYALKGRLPHLDWSGLALDFAYLAGANLANVSFHGSSLRYANLDNTNLENADFRDADLTGIQLERTAPVLAIAIDPETHATFAAYGDDTIRRWTVGVGGRATQNIVAHVDFRPQDLALSPHGDLVVTGESQAVVLSPAGATQSWNTVSRFSTRRDLRSACIVLDRLAVHRETPDGLVVLGLVDPATRAVSISTEMSEVGIVKFIGPDIVCTYSRQSELTVHVGVGRSDPSTYTIVVPPLASLDARLLDDGHALVLFGHEDGRISLVELSTEGAKPRVTELWQHTAHSRPVTTVAISAGFIVSGSADGTMRLYPLMDRWEIGEYLPLHRSVQCRGVLISGVYGPTERKLLQRLIDTDQKALVR